MRSLLVPLSCVLACATVPLDAPHGELVVLTNTGEAHVKALELQHQDYTHAESISGFEAGQDAVRQDVLAGSYCVERLIFDTGPAGGVVMPQNMCFEVGADGPTEIRIMVDERGRIGLRTDHAQPSANAGPPMAGPD